MALRACAPGAALRPQLSSRRSLAPPPSPLAHAPRRRRCAAGAAGRRAGARAALKLWTHPASRGKIVEWCTLASTHTRTYARTAKQPP
jgi:hypothetical protein